jgi:hypothetical protein
VQEETVTKLDPTEALRECDLERDDPIDTLEPEASSESDAGFEALEFT